MTWDYIKTEYKKQKSADPAWHLQRLLDHGLGNEKVDRKDLVKYFNELRMTVETRAFLELLLWNKKS